MSDIDALRVGIADLLESHPSILPFVSSVPESMGIRLRRYRTVSGNPIGHEHTPTTLQNIWVRRDDVRWNRLKDLEATLKLSSELADNTKANSNLFVVPEFRNADLIRFAVRDMSQAARVIAEVVS